MLKGLKCIDLLNVTRIFIGAKTFRVSTGGGMRYFSSRSPLLFWNATLLHLQKVQITKWLGSGCIDTASSRTASVSLCDPSGRNGYEIWHRTEARGRHIKFNFPIHLMLRTSCNNFYEINKFSCKLLFRIISYLVGEIWISSELDSISCNLIVIL